MRILSNKESTLISAGSLNSEVEFWSLAGSLTVAFNQDTLIPDPLNKYFIGRVLCITLGGMAGRLVGYGLGRLNQLIDSTVNT